MSSLQVQNLFGVTGKVVLVTGGSRGIGKMVSRVQAPTIRASNTFGTDCYRVCQKRCKGTALQDIFITRHIKYHRYTNNFSQVYISSRSSKDCDATAKELNGLGPGTCVPLPADLQKYSEVERLVKEIASREKVLHVLINNAGAAWGAPLDEFPVSYCYLTTCLVFIVGQDDAWTKVLTLNLQRVFTLTQKLLPLLRSAAIAGGKDGRSYNDPARIINASRVRTSGFPILNTFVIDWLSRGPSDPGP